MEANLSSVIHSWLYNYHQLGVQVIEDLNQSAKLRISCESAHLYLEVQGRPDGLKPHSTENFYLYLQDVMHKAENEGVPFSLSQADRQALEQEAALYLIRAQAYFRLRLHQLSEKDLLTAITSLEFIVEKSLDPIVREHYSKFLDVLILIYQKNLALHFQQQRDSEAAGSTLQWARRSLEKMHARASVNEFYFNEKDIKAVSSFVQDFDQIEDDIREDLNRHFVEKLSYAR